MKDKLLVSFSGGRTSAFMMKWIYDNWQDKYDIITIFANTGKESEKTLEFVEKCSNEWNIPIIWVEGKYRDNKGKPYSKQGWSVRYKLVDFKSASRKGEPFEQLISVLGIPTTNAPFCSYQLKRKVIERYLKDIGWGKCYKAIGIRNDEIDRVSINWKKDKIIYPLITDIPTRKIEIMNWFTNNCFDLDLKNSLGNCDNCWKKDIGNELRENAINNIETFDWWQKMTDKYGQSNPRKAINKKTGKLLMPPFNFYRGNLSPKDVIELSKKETEFTNQIVMNFEKLTDCTESCEVF